jgi:hypothetical protein
MLELYSFRPSGTGRRDPLQLEKPTVMRFWERQRRNRLSFSRILDGGSLSQTEPILCHWSTIIEMAHLGSLSHTGFHAPGV